MKLAIVGCEGRMGKELMRLAQNSKYKPTFVEVIGVSQTDDFASVAKRVDIVIDFSILEASMKHLAICVEQGCKYVCGVTGFSKEQLKEFENAAKQTPVFWSPNMSIGVAITNFLVGKAAQVLDRDFKIAIEETHHTKKLDAPSGTALMLKNSINKFRDEDFYIESKRIGDVVGVHEVAFASHLEKIEIKHEAFDRSVFADGALKVAIWLAKQKAGKLYDMRDFVGLV